MAFSTVSAPSSVLPAFSFGSTPATSSGFQFGQAPSAPSNFSFGGTSTVPAASSGFTFGAKSTALPSSHVSFGASAAPASTAPSLFNASTTAPPATGFGNFGNFSSFGTPTMPQPAATTGFGFGNPAIQPGAINGPHLTLETMFETLPDYAKKNMTEFYAYLKEQDQLDTLLKTVSPRQMDVLRHTMAQLDQQVLARRNGQDRQTAAVHHVRQNVRHLLHQVDAATLTRRSLDHGTRGTSTLYHVLRQVERPSPYYWELLDHYEHQMAALKAQIEEVEALWTPRDDNQRGSILGAKASLGPMQLPAILRAQHAALMQAAARVAQVHDQADKLRQCFLTKIRDDVARHGDKPPAMVQNPFDKSKQAARRQAIDTFRFRTSVAPTIVTTQPAPTATMAIGGGCTTTPYAPGTGVNVGPSVPAKTVSFNLSVPSTATGSNPVGGFVAPTVATSSWGQAPSSVSVVADPVSTAKRSGRAHKMRK